MSELRAIGLNGPSVAVYQAPTGTVYFLESDLAGLVAVSESEFTTIAGKRGVEVVEVDGQRLPMRAASWLFNLAESKDAPYLLRPLQVSARRLLRQLAETGLKTWIGQARPLARDASAASRCVT